MTQYEPKFKVGDKIASMWTGGRVHTVEAITVVYMNNDFYVLNNAHVSGIRLSVAYCDRHYVKIVDIEKVWQRVLNEAL